MILKLICKFYLLYSVSLDILFSPHSYCNAIICEYGEFCITDEDCQPANECSFANALRSQCVPKPNLYAYSKNNACSLNYNSCKGLPYSWAIHFNITITFIDLGCCSGNCDEGKICRPLRPPQCIFPESSNQNLAKILSSETLISPFKQPLNLPSAIQSSGNTSSPSYFFNCDSCISCGAHSVITIPSQVTFIPNNAFSGCTSITTVLIPTTVTGIGSYAFDNCNHINSIAFPTSVSVINSWAFVFCSSLTTIFIPTNLSVRNQ